MPAVGRGGASKWHQIATWSTRVSAGEIPRYIGLLHAKGIGEYLRQRVVAAGRSEDQSAEVDRQVESWDAARTYKNSERVDRPSGRLRVRS